MTKSQSGRYAILESLIWSRYVHVAKVGVTVKLIYSTYLQLLAAAFWSTVDILTAAIEIGKWKQYRLLFNIIQTQTSRHHILHSICHMQNVSFCSDMPNVIYLDLLRLVKLIILPISHRPRDTIRYISQFSTTTTPAQDIRLTQELHRLYPPTYTSIPLEN